jgi:hypothetical protein
MNKATFAKRFGIPHAQTFADTNGRCISECGCPNSLCMGKGLENNQKREREDQ